MTPSRSTSRALAAGVPPADNLAIAARTIV